MEEGSESSLINQKDILELIDILNTGETQRQEYALEKFNYFMEYPGIFFRLLFQIISETKVPLVRYQGSRLMEQIIRLKGTELSADDISEFREDCVKLLDILSPDDYKYSALTAMRLNKGSDNEWRKYNDRNFELPPEKKNEISMQIYNHLETDLLFQPIVEDTKFAFSFAEEFLKNEQHLAKIVYVKFINMYLAVYPNQTEELAPYFDGIVNIAKESLSFTTEEFIALWSHITKIFSVITIEYPIFEEISEIVKEYAQNESLDPIYRYYPLRIYEAVSGELEIDQVFAAADLAISIFAHGVDLVNLNSSLLIEFLDKIFSSYEHAYIAEYIITKAPQLTQMDTQASNITCMLLFNALLKNFSPWFLTHMESFKEHYEHWLSKDDPVLAILFCQLIVQFPRYFGYDLFDFNQIMQIAIPWLVSENADLRFCAVKNLIFVAEILIGNIKDITFPLLELADQIDEDIAGLYLTLLALCIKHESSFTTEQTYQLAEFIVPLFSDENLEIVNCAIKIAKELMMQNDQIQPELGPIVFGAIERCLGGDSIEIVLDGFERLGDLALVFPDESKEMFMANIDLLSPVVTDDSPWSVTLGQKALLAASHFITLGVNEHIDKLSERTDHLISSDDISYVAAAAKVLEVYCQQADVELIKQCVITLCKTIKALEANVTLIYLLTRLQNIMRRLSGDLYEELSPYCREIVLSYISGQLPFLNSVPPENTDIDFETLWSITVLCGHCLSPNDQDSLNEFFRFYNVLLERAEVPVERLVSVVLYFWTALLKHDLANEEMKAYIIEHVLRIYTPDTPKFIYMNGAKIMMLLITKGYVTAQMLEDKKDVITIWLTYIMENIGIMRQTLTPAIFLLWVIVGKFHLKDYYVDIFRASLQIEWPDVSFMDYKYIPYIHSYFKEVYPDDPETSTNVIKCNLNFLSLSGIKRHQLIVSPEYEQSVVNLVRGYVKQNEYNMKVLHEYCSENGRDDILQRILNE